MFNGLKRQWKKSKTEKMIAMIHYLVEEALLQKEEGRYVYSERQQEHYVVVIKNEDTYTLSLIEKGSNEGVFLLEMNENHPLYEKIHRDFELWGNAEKEWMVLPLHGLSRNQQVKYTQYKRN